MQVCACLLKTLAGDKSPTPKIVNIVDGYAFTERRKCPQVYSRLRTNYIRRMDYQTHHIRLKLMTQNSRIHNSQAMQSNITFANTLADDQLPSPLRSPTRLTTAHPQNAEKLLCNYMKMNIFLYCDIDGLMLQ